MSQMKIVVCNIGSSSLKFQLVEMPEERVAVRGHIDRLGSSESQIRYWVGDIALEPVAVAVSDQGDAVRRLLEFLKGPEGCTLAGQIDGVGFKCVQAGERNGTVELTDEVLWAMECYSDLAPAHNPPYLAAIRMFRELLPSALLVGVFEPGFHTDMPEEARIYGTPWDWIETYGVRKYGYHGASHRYVTGETVRRAGLDPGHHRIVSCHLGGSSSLCAYLDGRSIDTSMGFTPQTGLIQGTRIGDLDPFVLPYIMRKKGIDLVEALRECSQQAGLAGISGTSGDMRDILVQIERGSRRARLAREKFIYDIKRYIGQYIVLMEGLDAIAFTGGIGQQDAGLRERVLSSLGFLGVEIDAERNSLHAERITTAESSITALVIATNEEIVVARETWRLLADRRGLKA